MHAVASKRFRHHYLAAQIYSIGTERQEECDERERESVSEQRRERDYEGVGEGGDPIRGDPCGSYRLSLLNLTSAFRPRVPRGPWDVTVPAMTNGVGLEHKSRAPEGP